MDGEIPNHPRRLLQFLAESALAIFCNVLVQKRRLARILSLELFTAGKETSPRCKFTEGI